MTAKKSHITTAFTVLLMWCLLFVLFPHYRYYIDPDGVAYLTIAQRYAAGDYLRAINGYWSPWSCWLTAALIKMGIAAIPASVVINAAGAGCFIAISNSFFTFFRLQKERIWLNGALLVFCCYAVYAQSFDDIWECFFLLSALRMMASTRFLSQPGLWLLTAVAGSLAYFAKAYSFPFFILNTLVSVYFLAERKITVCIKVSAFVIGFMVLFSLPWIIALHYKYGIWTTSTAGSLNLSWYLVGHPFWKEGIDLLIPPPYPDSPGHWEDPFVANGPAPHFWTSWYYAGYQLLRLGLNAWKFTYSVAQLSPMLLVVLFVAVLRWYRKKKEWVTTAAQQVVIMSACIFPLGYALINYESRYLWYVLPVAMAAVLKYPATPWAALPRRIMAPLIAISFILYPLWRLAGMYNDGKDEFEVAAQLKKAGLQGSFTGREHQRIMGRLAYFWGTQYYYTTNLRAREESYIADAQRYRVNYYVRYYNRFEGDSAVKQPTLPKSNHPISPPVEVYNDHRHVQVFRLD
jgi:hypothetical protein